MPSCAYPHAATARRLPWLTKAAVCGPFAEAISVIAEMTGVRLPMRSAEAIVADAAADFDDFYANRAGKRPAKGDPRRGHRLQGHPHG